MATVHPTATVDSACELAEDVTIGPWCVVEGRVQLASGVTVMGNNHLRGPLTVGPGTTIYPFACLGFPAQHRRIAPDAPNAGIRIGRDCVIREGRCRSSFRSTGRGQRCCSHGNTACATLRGGQ